MMFSRQELKHSYYLCRFEADALLFHLYRFYCILQIFDMQKYVRKNVYLVNRSKHILNISASILLQSILLQNKTKI